MGWKLLSPTLCERLQNRHFQQNRFIGPLEQLHDEAVLRALGDGQGTGAFKLYGEQDKRRFP